MLKNCVMAKIADSLSVNSCMSDEKKLLTLRNKISRRDDAQNVVILIVKTDIYSLESISFDGFSILSREAQLTTTQRRNVRSRFVSYGHGSQ